MADAQSGFGADLTGKVKFGTADEDEGLGTGEEDYSVLLDLYQSAGDWTLFGGAGYTFFGDSRFIRLRNAASANAGASYGLDQGDSLGVIFDYRERISAASEPRRSDGSLDWGVGVSLKYGF